MRKALILGITGQDGSYLAELLLSKGYEVHGLHRRSSTDNTGNIKQILDKITLHEGDMVDPISIYRTIDSVRPHEIYNEADQDNVGWSRNTVGYNMDITAASVGRTLESIRMIDSDIRFFQPVSATMFSTDYYPQNEDTPFAPTSPYACAKVAAYYLVKHYRKTHGLFASTAIFFNHDSPRRTEQYLLPKICRSAVRIARGEQNELYLGNTDATVDIGYAPEYVEAAWNILQHNKPDDFVISSNESVRIRTILEVAFCYAGLKSFNGVKKDPKFYSDTVSPTFFGDSTKARKAFGFSPQVDMTELVEIMISSYRSKL